MSPGQKGWVAAGVLFTLATAVSARAAELADECVSVQRTEQSDGLSFEVKNNCDRRLACSLSWRVTCENAAGKPTSSEAKSASFGVAPSTGHQVFGSAASCHSAWRIDDVTWACAPPK